MLAPYDLHDKKLAYQRAGVKEYLVWKVHEQVLTWLSLQADGYVELSPDESAIVRSQVFPGLWLQTTAMISGALSQVLATLQSDLRSPEHEAFDQRLC